MNPRNTRNLEARAIRAFKRFFPDWGPLTLTHKSAQVLRVTDDVTGRWAEYTYAAWRIRRIDQGERA